MFKNLNTLIEIKKYTNQMKRQFSYLLKEKKRRPSEGKREISKTEVNEVINPFLNKKSIENLDLMVSADSPSFPEFKSDPNVSNLSRKNNFISPTKYETVIQANQRTAPDFSFYQPSFSSLPNHSIYNEEKNS